MLSALAEAEGLNSQDEKELYVKIYPPAQLRPSFSTTLKSKSSFSLFKFLNRFVPHSPILTDPVMSKTLLAMFILSVILNGYLLRGIASGFVGNAGAALLGGNEHQDGVKFEDTVKSDEEEIVIKKEERPQLTLRLQDVDRKLELEKAQREMQTPSPSSSARSFASPTRSLEECIDVFENGPRPLSLSMELLTDEEIILLAQNGKIAAYALEKVLGTSNSVALERAVRIRRALICKSLFIFSSNYATN